MLPLADGRVLIHRRVDGRHAFSLLYPTGPGTGELPLGAVECADAALCAAAARRRTASCAYALAPRPASRPRSGWWRAAPSGPSTSPRCRGAARAGSGWTVRAGCWRWTGSWTARTKAVAVDLERGGEVSPAAPDHRGQRRPAAAGRPGQRAAADPLGRARGRGPAGLGGAGQHAAGALPGVPAARGVRGHAVRRAAGAGADAGELRGRAADRRCRRGSWVGVWRPAERRLHHLAGAGGWLAGAGLWSQGRGAPTAVRHGRGAVRGGSVRGPEVRGDGRRRGIRER